jgi:mono/diheme cytochrome c family protein
MRVFAMLPLFVIVLALPLGTRAAQPTLAVGGDGRSQEYGASALLERPDAVSITVQDDVSYRRAMTYRAVPLLALLQGASADRFDTLEARATDGFVAQIPLELVTQGAKGGAVAYLAVEDPTHPWPVLPNQKASAGPFYLVWDHPQRSNVRVEQWPYALASITLAHSPLHRWPQLALPASHSADAAAQSGQKVFVTFCLPCHRLNGAGEGKVGPDLARPMNVTRYLTGAGLRAIVRDPTAVRTWPEQRMTGFDRKRLPDADLEALVAYLQAMADTPGPRPGQARANAPRD